uniref:G-protein coupled receptors family 1 profile domain-containing protein n=1 Tax=Clytia hemisphaerica TaxID=252671 RepID=A0A7M5WZQ5_9CNID
LELTTSTYILFVLCSIFHLVFIALDRLWAIVRPIKHNIFMTRKKVYTILSTIWMLGIVVALALHYTNDRGHLFQDQYEFELVEDEDDNHNTTTALTNTDLTPLSTITTAPPITIHHIISNLTDGGRNRTNRPRTTRQLPSEKPLQFRKILLAYKILVYRKFMQLLLSGFILGADILLALIYSLIITECG